MRKSILSCLSAFLMAFAVSACVTIPPDECIEKPCESGCSREMRPVCGCNDKTYHNPCLAECHGITQYTEGPCPENRSPAIIKGDSTDGR